MPLISIIHTTYRQENFTRSALDSVLSQSFTDWEILIGDDSPDDASWEIIQEYVAQYPDKIRAWHHSPNKGLAANMKFLIEQASSESQYISFLEGDDMYAPDNLDEKKKIFEKYAEVWAVTTGVSFCDQLGKNKKILSVSTPEYFQKEGKKKYTISDMLLGIQTPVRSFGNVIFKKELLKYTKNIDLKEYNDDKMFIPYDFVFWLSIFPETIVYHTRKKLLIYRFHENNNSSPKNFKKWLEQMIFVYNLYKDIYSKEALYLSNIVRSKRSALEWKNREAMNLFIQWMKIYPFKHFMYKISIFLDILKIKNLIIKILFILWNKQ